MSNHTHHVIVVTCWEDQVIQEAHEFARREGLPVTPVSEPQRNGYQTFAVVPHGSGALYPLYAAQEIARERFRAYLRLTVPRLEWFEAEFGADLGGARITDDGMRRRHVSIEAANNAIRKAAE